MKNLITIDNDINNVLKKTCMQVKIFGKKLSPIIQNMFDVMNKNNGIGLAASQIGLLQQIIIIDNRYFINPIIIFYDDEKDIEEESCLSFPKKFIEKEESKKIIIKFQDIHRKLYIKEYKDFEARVLQHEIDHLYGKCII